MVDWKNKEETNKYRRDRYRLKHPKKEPIIDWNDANARKQHYQEYYYKNHEEMLLRAKRYQIENKKMIDEKRPNQQRILRQKRKLEIFARLSNGEITCRKCGYSDTRALQIDHVNGDGHGISHTKKRDSYYLLLLKMPIEELLQNYQLLCSNCNWIKRYENNEYVKSWSHKNVPKQNRTDTK